MPLSKKTITYIVINSCLLIALIGCWINYSQLKKKLPNCKTDCDKLKTELTIFKWVMVALFLIFVGINWRTCLVIFLFFAAISSGGDFGPGTLDFSVIPGAVEPSQPSKKPLLPKN